MNVIDIAAAVRPAAPGGARRRRPLFRAAEQGESAGTGLGAGLGHRQANPVRGAFREFSAEKIRESA